MRILVTGSREFASPNTIREALTEATEGQPGPHTLVHGDAKGADRMVVRIARGLGWTIEAHPADWNRPCAEHCKHRGGRRTRNDGSSWCPSAGAVRNAQMCELGADLVLAFYARGARNVGTADCVKSAGKNKIPVKRFTA
jgi:SLOG family YspA-like protein